MDRLEELYAAVAVDSYTKVAKQFDTVGSLFTAAARKSDPEAASDSIVSQADPVRTAWLDATKHAAELDRLQLLVIAAAEWYGIGIPRRDRDPVLIALLCDPDGLHRRRVWEAWRRKGSRCGIGAR